MGEGFVELEPCESETGADWLLVDDGQRKIESNVENLKYFVNMIKRYHFNFLHAMDKEWGYY